MKKRYVTVCTMALLMLTAALLLAGCGKKSTDPETQEVLKISITPDPTPTAAPETVNSDAVVTNDGITMVNSYLSGGSGTAGTESGNTENTEDTGNDGTVSADGSADSGISSDTSGEDTSETDSENE